MVTWTMNDNEKLKDIIKKDLDVRANERTYTHMRDIVLDAHEHPTGTESATTLIHKGRPIMKNPITKLALAAAVIAAVVLGLFEFISTDTGSGVVWAEVAQKVQASRGVIFRMTEEIEPNKYSQGVDFTMNYYSSTQSRLDKHKAGQVIGTIYGDCNTKTVILVDHTHKSYVQDTAVKNMPDSLGITDPNHMVQKFLSCEHRQLEPKTIDAVLCEGIETTDTTFYGTENQPDSLTAQIWVSIETGYPVRYQSEHTRDDGQTQISWVADQFQWDVELDEQLFEPNVPEGYVDISPDEW